MNTMRGEPIPILKMSYSKVFVVCKELFSARGYQIVEEGMNETNAWYIKGIGSDVMYLYVLMQNKLNVEMIKYYYNLFVSKGIKHAILVYQTSVTPSVKKILLNFDIHIELFCMDELRYNILKHELVPRHTKVDAWKTNAKKYPILKRTDPVSKFLGFKGGDVIRIDRRDKSIYFRFVK